MFIIAALTEKTYYLTLGGESNELPYWTWTSSLTSAYFFESFDRAVVLLESEYFTKREKRPDGTRSLPSLILSFPSDVLIGIKSIRLSEFLRVKGLNKEEVLLTPT